MLSSFVKLNNPKPSLSSSHCTLVVLVRIGRAAYSMVTSPIALQVVVPMVISDLYFPASVTKNVGVVIPVSTSSLNHL
jgi:hypothetical protein